MMARTGRAPLIVAITVALVLVTASSAVAWWMVRDLHGQDQSNRDTQMLSAVLGMSRHADALALLGAVETNLGMTRDSVIAGRAAIAEHKAALDEQMSILAGGNYTARVNNLAEQVALLTSNVDRIEAGRPDLLRALLAAETNRVELIDTVSRKLTIALTNSVDNQFYYMMTGRSEFRETGEDIVDESELTRLRRLSTLGSAAGTGFLALQSANRMTDPTLVTTLEEVFDSTRQQAKRSIEYLSANGGPDIDESVVPLAERLFQIGPDPINYFDEIRARLSMAVAERELIAANQQILERLGAEIDGLVQEIQRNAASEADQSDQATSTAGAILLGIVIVGLIATLAAARHLASGGGGVRQS